MSVDWLAGGLAAIPSAVAASQGWVVVLHLVTTLLMCGLIWFVQVVHYPLFARVGPAGFAAYERSHARRTTVVVAPLMLTEAATTTVLWLTACNPTVQALATAGLVLLLVIWMSTACLQVPCHRRLEAGFDAAVVRRLVAGNWIRTMAWTGRAAMAVAIYGQVAS